MDFPLSRPERMSHEFIHCTVCCVLQNIVYFAVIHFHYKKEQFGRSLSLIFGSADVTGLSRVEGVGNKLPLFNFIGVGGPERENFLKQAL